MGSSNPEDLSSPFLCIKASIKENGSVSEIWSEDELKFCVRAYLWMRDAEASGYKVKKKIVEKALIAGPLAKRTRLDYRYANISSVMQKEGLTLLSGYKPQDNVGANVEAVIKKQISDYRLGRKESKYRHLCRLECLVKQIPKEAYQEAARRLIDGEDYSYKTDSRDYDVYLDGTRIPPKPLTALASEIYYGAPLESHNFTGGADSDSFAGILSAGLRIIPKDLSEITNPESDSFRNAVEKAKAKPKERPLGNKKPKKHITTSEQYERDPRVVAHAEKRANGICELSNQPAPFTRENGSPFLEVHHIIPLSEGGEDVVHNVAALSPNCHREAHYGVQKKEIRKFLLKKIRKLENVR